MSSNLNVCNFYWFTSHSVQPGFSIMKLLGELLLPFGRTLKSTAASRQHFPNDRGYFPGVGGGGGGLPYKNDGGTRSIF